VPEPDGEMGDDAGMETSRCLLDFPHSLAVPLTYTSHGAAKMAMMLRTGYRRSESSEATRDPLHDEPSRSRARSTRVKTSSTGLR
jgi:hypothetical protein